MAQPRRASCATRGFRWLQDRAVALRCVAILAYMLVDVQPRPNGGSWYGYTLGTIGALLILWLTLLGIRKRAMTRGRWSLKAWTAAHVYLGLSLIVIATLHTGFQFGWNVHTLAYALMMLVIVSGIYGISVYVDPARARSATTAREMTGAQMIDAVASSTSSSRSPPSRSSDEDSAIVHRLARRGPVRRRPLRAPVRPLPAAARTARALRLSPRGTARRRAAASRRARSSRSSACSSARRRALGRIRRHVRLQGAARSLALRPRAADLRADRRAGGAHRQRLLLLVGASAMAFLLRTVIAQRRRARDRPHRAGRGRPADASAAIPKSDIRLTDLAVALHHATVERRRRPARPSRAEPGLTVELDGRKAPASARSTLGTGRRHPDRQPFLLRFMPTPAGGGGRSRSTSSGSPRARRSSTRAPTRLFALAPVMPGKRADGLAARPARARPSSSPGRSASSTSGTHRRRALRPRYHADGCGRSGRLSQRPRRARAQLQACHVKPFESGPRHGLQGLPHRHPRPCRSASGSPARDAGPRPAGAGSQLAFGRPSTCRPGRCVDCHTEHQGAAAHAADAAAFLRRLPHRPARPAARHEARQCRRFRQRSIPNSSRLVLPAGTATGRCCSASRSIRIRARMSGLKFPHALHLGAAGGVAQMARTLRPIRLRRRSNAATATRRPRRRPLPAGRHGAQLRDVPQPRLRPGRRHDAHAAPRRAGAGDRRPPRALPRRRPASAARALALRPPPAGRRAADRAHADPVRPRRGRARRRRRGDPRRLLARRRLLRLPPWSQAAAGLARLPDRARSPSRPAISATAGSTTARTRSCSGRQPRSRQRAARAATRDRSQSAQRPAAARTSPPAATCHGGERTSKPVASTCAMCHDYHRDEGAPAMLIRQQVRGQRRAPARPVDRAGGAAAGRRDADRADHRHPSRLRSGRSRRAQPPAARRGAGAR